MFRVRQVVVSGQIRTRSFVSRLNLKHSCICGLLFFVFLLEFSERATDALPVFFVDGIDRHAGPRESGGVLIDDGNNHDSRDSRARQPKDDNSRREEGPGCRCGKPRVPGGIITRCRRSVCPPDDGRLPARRAIAAPPAVLGGHHLPPGDSPPGRPAGAGNHREGSRLTG